MPQIIVVNQSGEESNVEAPEGRTLMEVIRDEGFDELLALCGG
ncbi:MAG TPA: ferredoxin, partial [Novosphingobium sp.]|nr:ferredoxin [Novosphingobium sp.]